MVATMTPVPRHTRRQRAFVPGTTIDAFKASPAILKAATTFSGIVKRSGVNLFGYDLADSDERRAALDLIAHVAFLNEAGITDSDLTRKYGMNATLADQQRVNRLSLVRDVRIHQVHELATTLGPTHVRELLTAATTGGR